MKLAKLTFLLLFIGISLYGQYDGNKGIVFTSLESALKEIPSRVYYLDLKQKDLQEFPKEVLQFNNLIHLNLAHNNIKNLDGIDLSSLISLESIILYDNKFRFIPYEVLGSARNLRQIDLGENDLKSLDASINQIRFLENIDLGGNRITTTAKNIKLPFFKKLNIERNNLSAFPDFLQFCPRLESLNVYGNNIRFVPERLNTNSKLDYLNIGDNPLQNINKNIKLRKLKTLILDWIDLSEDSLSLNIIEQASFLEILSLEHCNLNTIPKELNKLKRLKELSLLNNELTGIDKQFLKKKKLSKLWLGGNQISESNIKELKATAKRTEIIH